MYALPKSLLFLVCVSAYCLVLHKTFTYLTHRHTSLQIRSWQKQIIKIKMCIISLLILQGTSTNSSRYPGFLGNHIFAIEPWVYVKIALPASFTGTREIQWLSQIHPARKWQTRIWTPRLFAVYSYHSSGLPGYQGKKMSDDFSQNHMESRHVQNKAMSPKLHLSCLASHILHLKAYSSEFTHIEFCHLTCKLCAVTRLE